MGCTSGIWSFLVFYCSPPSPGHLCLSIGLKTGGKRKQAHWNTKTSLARAGWQLPGWDTRLPVAGDGCAEGGHLVSCVALPGSLKRNKEQKLGRAGHTRRPQHPHPATGSPQGPTCGFSPVRRNTHRIKLSTLPSTGVPGIPHPAGGCRCGSSTFDNVFLLRGFFCSLGAGVMHTQGVAAGYLGIFWMCHKF